MYKIRISEENLLELYNEDETIIVNPFHIINCKSNLLLVDPSMGCHDELIKEYEVNLNIDEIYAVVEESITLSAEAAAKRAQKALGISG